MAGQQTGSLGGILACDMLQGGRVDMTAIAVAALSEKLYDRRDQAGERSDLG